MQGNPDAHCFTKTPEAPLFGQDWWWDAVCLPQNRHEIVFRDKKGSVRGLWRMAEVRRMGIFQVYGMPSLTQHAGVYLADRQDFINLLSQLPPKKNLCLNLGFKLNDKEVQWLQGQGIHVEKRVSHRLEDLSDLEKVYQGVKTTRRQKIRRAERSLSVFYPDDIEPLIELQAETFRRRGMKNLYPPQTVRKLYQAVKEHQAGKLIALKDSQDRIVACGLFVHDNSICYCLTHGVRKLEHDLGAGSLLLWKGIEYAAKRGVAFDFEGSNIKQIADFNLSFGASEGSYFRLERYSTFFRLGERLWNRLKPTR